jgi:hypothetical protein
MRTAKSRPTATRRGFIAWIIDVPSCDECKSKITETHAWSCVKCDATLHERCILTHRRACPQRRVHRRRHDP